MEYFESVVNKILISDFLSLRFHNLAQPIFCKCQKSRQQNNLIFGKHS